MAELLDRIEEDLVGVEEELLAEFSRIRKMEWPEPYSKIDPFLKNKLEKTIQGLRHDLDHSGDAKHLTLRTDRHEQLYSRIYVTIYLLDKPVPTAFIDMCHQEVLQSRREHEQNKERKQERVQIYLDGGIYSDSRELSVLNDVTEQHHEEGLSIEEIIEERAQFLARDLTNAPVKAKDGPPRIARSTDEIRKKLEGKTSFAGPSAFEAKDIASVNEEMPDPSPKKSIAQSPDEIRRKLQERGASGSSQGASSFEAKDLSSSLPPTPPPLPRKKVKPKEVAQTPEEIRKKLAERQAGDEPKGKAVFGAKDIEPVASNVPPKPRKKEEPAKPSGKAVFESKDLSKKPPGQ